MLKINSYVNYGASGVCKIEERKSERIRNVLKQYYVLRPVFVENSAVYVPVDNENLVSKITPVISVAELDSMISDAADRKDEWIESDFERSEKYKEILRSGNRAEIIEIIRVIHRRQKELMSKGKHLHVIDERLKREAQAPLCSEIAFVKDITTDEALTLILNSL